MEPERPKEVRWSARRKADAVMRLLRGASLDGVSWELRVEAHCLAARDEFRRRPAATRFSAVAPELGGGPDAQARRRPRWRKP